MLERKLVRNREREREGMIEKDGGWVAHSLSSISLHHPISHSLSLFLFHFSHLSLFWSLSLYPFLSPPPLPSLSLSYPPSLCSLSLTPSSPSLCSPSLP